MGVGTGYTTERMNDFMSKEKALSFALEHYRVLMSAYPDVGGASFGLDEFLGNAQKIFNWLKGGKDG